jgi:hypothetical protein
VAGSMNEAYLDTRISSAIPISKKNNKGAKIL